MANDRSRFKHNIVRLINRYNWHKNDVAYVPLSLQHFFLSNWSEIIFGFFELFISVEGSAIGFVGVGSWNANSGDFIGVIDPSTIINHLKNDN